MNILAFVITVLLIPALIYIWTNNKREMKEMKKTIERHQTDNVEQRRILKDDVADCKLENEKIRNNYLSKFGELNIHISKEFKLERAANVEEHRKLAITISEINITMTAIAGKLSNIKLKQGV